MLEIRDRKTQMAWAAGLTFVFFMVAYLGRFTNLGYSGDSVMIYQSPDAAWQIELGRYLHLLYWKVRGRLVAPYLIGVLAASFLSIAFALIAQMFELRSRIAIATCSLFLSCNLTLSASAATFIHELDLYMLSLLLVVVSVWVWRNVCFGFLLAPLFLCASLALYQSYLQVEVLLLLMLLCVQTLQGEKLGKIMSDGFSALFVLLAGLLIYALSLKIVTWKTGISTQTTPRWGNGLGNMGNYGSITDIAASLFENWCFPFIVYMNPESHLPGLSAVVQMFLVLISPVLAVMVWKKRKLPVFSIGFAMVFILLMPLGMNCVRFISKGYVYHPMIYSYYLLFLLPVVLLNQMIRENMLPEKTQIISFALSTVLFYCNFVYAGQMMLERTLQYDATLSLMTRVLDRLEQTEGFDPVETPVAFVGSLQDSLLDMKRPGFEHVMPKNGFDLAYPTLNYAVLEDRFYKWYFWQILGYPINIVSDYERDMIAQRDEARDMPVFPQTGSVKMLDDVMVVKIGFTASSEEAKAFAQ